MLCDIAISHTTIKYSERYEMVTLVILVEALSDCGETEVKLQFHPQTKDNQQLAESETGETENRYYY